ncbi:Ornithine decarboxylase antizyme [Mycena sanguinolenta]|uniref:Ornithine decarboxylase antizyme n=1 Tax=Mycena sanguinolenta TaxID=230812 RepID=A0A8H6ZBL2_9AGAR|nr:Ornithine decarboxylase antizyme [Mycena sanguinolenta]
MSSPRPTNGRQTVGDGACSFDAAAPSVLAVAHLQGTDDMYYYSTTFSGGPGPKCPPDRGSSDCVTGSLASYTASNNNNSYFHSPSFPLSIPHLPSLLLPSATTTKKDALDFLMTIFPRHALAALPYSRSVAISAPNIGAAFDGVVLQLPGMPKTLYVDGKSAQSVSIRESIVALLDLADESLECSALVIALDRSSPALGKILHSLMYVGGTVVTKPPFEVDSAFVLVGLEI